MTQLPFPTADTAHVEVPLPEGFERWRDLYLHDVSQKVIVFLAFALLLYFLSRVAQQQVGVHITDVNRRHTLRKTIKYGYVSLLVLIGIALFADALAGFGTVVALVLAGIAVALQDVLKSVVGWLYISTRSDVQVGSRVEVSGVTGDVIDVGVLKTTLLEVGNLVYGRQSTGRLVTVPNYRMLSENVLSSDTASPFVWQEIKLIVTFESDWERAEAILREIANELHAEIAADLELGFRTLERRFAFKYGMLTPIVYVAIGDPGVELTLRFLTHVRRRRGSTDRVSRRILIAFAREEDVELAYPTYRIFQLPEPTPGRHGAADMYLEEDPSHDLTDAEEGQPPPDMVG